MNRPGQDIPKLSLAAAVELRRIYCKHVEQTLPTRETRELLAGGFIAGHFAGEPERFVVEAVTPVGLAAIQQHEAAADVESVAI